jgi:hypothetical protein
VGRDEFGVRQLRTTLPWGGAYPLKDAESKTDSILSNNATESLGFVSMWLAAQASAPVNNATFIILDIYKLLDADYQFGISAVIESVGQSEPSYSNCLRKAAN